MKSIAIPAMAELEKEIEAMEAELDAKSKRIDELTQKMEEE